MISERFNITAPASCLDLPEPTTAAEAAILTPGALDFVAALHREFNPLRLELLHQRKLRQQNIDRGELPGFLEETSHIRESAWTVDPVLPDLDDRRVEITGPVDRKMVINALNSGARCYMADFEDSHSPTWQATMEGQSNLKDAIRRQIQYTSPDGKRYRLKESVATLLVRPRGWHLVEKHMLIDGEPVSGSLFDFGLYFFHNARERVRLGSGVYLYLPKLQHYIEARLWNNVFTRAESLLGLPHGTVKATVLIEHILAAYQMHEILYDFGIIAPG
jgi:malate synthase